MSGHAPINLGRQLHRDYAARYKRQVRAIRRELRAATEWHGGKRQIPAQLMDGFIVRERAANRDAAWHLAQLTKLA